MHCAIPEKNSIVRSSSAKMLGTLLIISPHLGIVLIL